MSTPDPQPPHAYNIGFREAIEAAAYRRGLLRAAEIADDFAMLHVEAVAYGAEQIAARIRSEADTPGETAP